MYAIKEYHSCSRH